MLTFLHVFAKKLATKLVPSDFFFLSKFKPMLVEEKFNDNDAVE